MNKITYGDFLDKIHGCWYGKCLGGAAGGPVEGIKKLIEVNDFEEIFDPNLPNDDLDMQLLWLYVLENKGVNITSNDLADAWTEKCWYPFSEYGYFLKNYERGILPPYTGIINNSFYKEGMGCPIRSEIWGIISAGNPKLASMYAYLDATLDHADNSVYAEQFMAVCESIAFFETDMIKIITKGMDYIPKDSKLYECFMCILGEYEKGTDWISVRKEVLKRYAHPDFTNAVQNMGFILIALLYGESDMRKTINIALKCGYDADCTCASAASLLGIVTGYKNMGKEITSLIKDYFVCGIDVSRPSDSIKRLSEDTLKISLSIDNEHLFVTDLPPELSDIKKEKVKLEIIKPTDEGLKTELLKTNPMHFSLYGPYFEQLEQCIDKRYPSPHGEGCNLPDLVCMVNNQVFLDKAYIDEETLVMPESDLAGEIKAYEDLIPVDDCLTPDGQICVYLKTTVVSPKAQKVWFVIGNSDGFNIWLNKKSVLYKDEIRLYTPYNNFCLADLREGENEVVLKLLRRTESLKFAFGIRQYNGQHWHRSKWNTDLYFK